MRRRDFIAALAAAAWPPSAWPSSARAQSSARRYLIGVLDTSARPLNPNFDVLAQALAEHGYVEGRNVAFEYRSADGRNERFPEIARELVERGVNVIVTRGTPAALAAKAASATVPVVMAAAGDPVAIARDPVRPALNMTGFGAFVRGVEGKRVEILRDMLPKVERVSALMNLSNPSRASEWREVEAAARALGIEAQVLDARAAADIEPAFQSATRWHADGLVVGSDTLMQANQRRVVTLAAEHRLPAIYTFRDFVDAGGLVSYGVSLPDLYRRAAGYVDKILTGAKPADLPIEPPTKLELVINLAAADALGVTVPKSMLSRTDAIIR
jgi:putative ABC transport system substrate-binding protein